MQDKTIRFGIIGLGLMGKEFGSSVARWCNLLDDRLPRPVITGICGNKNTSSVSWFSRNFESIKIITRDYRELLDSDNVDAVYCAVPHNLHQKIYSDILLSGKHLLGEKPFGIDLAANKKIMDDIRRRPGLVVRCSSEFPFFPGSKKVIEWLQTGNYGRLIEVRSGFHHSSDMDPNKPINWKRIVESNGEYGCMGDLGLHTQHIPFRMGWKPKWVFADLQKVIRERPDETGNMVPCRTFDNAVLTTRCDDALSGNEFTLVLETKRMAPGQTNTWFIEVYGTKSSMKFTTHDPRSVYYLETSGKEQGWNRIDIGSQSFIPTITGGIFEPGFSDAFQQMIGAYLLELSDSPFNHPFGTVLPEETLLSHQLMTAALKSFKTGRRVDLAEISG